MPEKSKSKIVLAPLIPTLIIVGGVVVWLQVSVTEVEDVAKAWDHREYSIRTEQINITIENGNNDRPCSPGSRGCKNHESTGTSNFRDHASIRNDLRETTTKIPTTTTMTTETTKIKSNITNEVGLVAAADDLPPKKKRCSLLQDANARSACYSDNYLDFPAKPEIICTERELQDTQLRSLCANYQVYASTTEAATTVRPNNGPGLIPTNTSLCYSNGELSENIRNTLSFALTTRYCDQLNARIPESLDDVMKLKKANLIDSALGTWFGARFDTQQKKYIYDKDGTEFKEPMRRARQDLIQYAQVNIRYHASWWSIDSLPKDDLFTNFNKTVICFDYSPGVCSKEDGTIDYFSKKCRTDGFYRTVVPTSNFTDTICTDRNKSLPIVDTNLQNYELNLFISKYIFHRDKWNTQTARSMGLFWFDQSVMLDARSYAGNNFEWTTFSGKKLNFTKWAYGHPQIYDGLTFSVNWPQNFTREQRVAKNVDHAEIQFISSTMDQAKNFLCVADTYGSGNVTNYVGIDNESLPGSEIRKKKRRQGDAKSTPIVSSWEFVDNFG